MPDPLRVLVLAGGPDAEREVSLASGRAVAAALREAGHRVIERDVSPADPSALDEPCDVVFPALHGKWGEGGGVQRLMDQRSLRYVGAGAAAAALCMDKAKTKATLAEAGLPTPAWEVLGPAASPTLAPPVVVKALDEGSSLGLFLCHTDAEVAGARAALHATHDRLMIETLVPGKEITVGVLDGGGLTSTTPGGPPSVRGKLLGGPPSVKGKLPGGGGVLPPIWIRPAVDFYDYQAKYSRDDTRYVFDLGLGEDTAEHIRTLAWRAHAVLGAGHLSRVDFMVDAGGAPWILEVNTMPGFTGHSLLPMAAREAGLDMPGLVDRLVRWAAGP